MNTCDQILRIFESTVSYCMQMGYKRTRIAMEGLFGIDRSRGETETVCVERNYNYTYVEQPASSRSYVQTLIVYGPCTPPELLAFLPPPGRSPDSIDECALKNLETTATDSSQK